MAHSENSLGSRVIVLLTAEPGLMPKEMSERLGAEVGTMSAVLSTMFNGGVVRREAVRPEGSSRDTYRYWILDPDAPRHIRRKNPKPRKARAKNSPTVVAAPAPEVESVTPSAPPVIAEVEAKPRNALLVAIEHAASAFADHMMAELQAELADRIVSLMTTIQQRTIDAPTSKQLVEQLSVALTPKKTQLSSVLILGLLPNQAGMIVEEFGSCFDLRFWKDQSNQMLKQNARNADYVISFLSKLGHDAESTVKSVNRDIIRCPGGMTALRNKLTDLYVADEERNKKV